MKNTKLSKLIKISLLAAISYVIMYIAFPLPLFPTYLTLDFSDLPILLGTFSMGPVAGVVIELVKNLLHFLLNTQTGGTGELANFIVGSALAFTAGTIYKMNKSRKTAGIALITGTLAMTLAASLGNYFIFMPLYGIKTGLLQMVLYAIIPFNIVKGLILSVITFFTYKYFSPILHK